MEARALISLLLVGGLLLVSADPGLAADSPKLDQVVQGQNQLALDLYGLMSPTEGNIFFSPTSIHLALAMTYGGARGETAAEMARALGFPDDAKTLHAGNHALYEHLVGTGAGKAQLSLANSLWPSLDLTLEDSFLNLCLNNYGARPRGLDFGQTEAARHTINAWVAENTNQMIPELLLPGDLTPDVLLVLANAIHFKGTWLYRFAAEQTRPRSFHTASGEVVQVPTMALEADLAYLQVPGAQVVQMPYSHGNLAMTLVVPDDLQGLAALEGELVVGSLASWLDQLRPQGVDLTLPRFEMSRHQALRPLLQELGMKRAFSPAADFSGIAHGPLFIDNVIHEAAISVDELGTEAAAATAVVMRKSMNRRPHIRADHPFLFLIRDLESGAILFMGRVSDPTS